jgi:hypothetical protein
MPTPGALAVHIHDWRIMARNIEATPGETPGPKGQERNNLFPASEAENGATTDNFYVRTTVPATAGALDALLGPEAWQEAPAPTLYAPDFGDIHRVTAGPING